MQQLSVPPGSVLATAPLETPETWTTTREGRPFLAAEIHGFPSVAWKNIYHIYNIWYVWAIRIYQYIYIIIYHHLPIYSKSILLINTCMLCNQMIHKHWKHGKKLMENYDIGSWKREIWRALLWNQMICGKVRLGDSNGKLAARAAMPSRILWRKMR